MSRENDVELYKELFEFIVLFGFIIIRLLPIGRDTNTIIKLAGYVGLIVSVFDFYMESKGRFSNDDKFHIIRGIMGVIIVILAILLVVYISGYIKINNVCNDVFTLTALLITMPKRLYFQLLEKYINGGKINE